MNEGKRGGDDDGVGVGIGCSLSGNKDFFDVILSKTNVTSPHHLVHILVFFITTSESLVLNGAFYLI